MNTRFLFPGTKFIIRYKSKQLLEVYHERLINWTEYVINWMPFFNIIHDENEEKIILKFAPDGKTPAFYSYFYQDDDDFFVPADVVVSNCKNESDEERIDKEGDVKINKMDRIIFIISCKYKKLFQLDNEGHRMEVTEWVSNLEPLYSLVNSDNMYEEFLLLKIRPDGESLAFYNYVSPYKYIPIEYVFDSKHSLQYVNALKEFFKCDGKNKMKRQGYDTYRKKGDNIITMIGAFQDSGMSREEAVEFAKICIDDLIMYKG